MTACEKHIAIHQEPLQLEDLKLLVDSARWAASGGNLQPWKFVIVMDKKMLEAIKMMAPGIIRDTPPALIIICHDEKRISGDREMQLYDIGAAMQNMLLMAHALGLGACPIASFDGESVAELLELPSQIKPVLLICVGKAVDMPKPPHKLSMDEVTIKIV